MSVLTGLDELSSGQWGLLTTAQAVQAGVPRMRLSREVASGRLERLLAGVYRDSGAPVDPLQGVRAAWLASDPSRTAEERLADRAAGVVVGGATAAYVHGIGDLQPEPVELYSPTRRQTERPGLRYRIRQLEDRDTTLANGLPVTSIERTLADLVADRHDLTLVIDALRDAARITSLDLDRLETLLDPYAVRLGQPDGAALLRWLTNTGQIELRPARTADEVRQRWLQQTVQIALPDLEPLRRTVLTGMLDATRLQETVAAAIRSGALEQTMRAAATASSAPAIAALHRAVSAQVQAQIQQLTVTQMVLPDLAPALQAAVRSSRPNPDERRTAESS